jgi:hypothetical protein
MNGDDYESYDSDFDEELPRPRKEPEGYRDYKFPCKDCGRENALNQYHIDHGYHCDTCTRNTEQTGGIYGF